VNPYLFAVGAPRSGTTVLQRLLDAHPQLCVAFETHWIPYMYRHRRGVAEDGTVGMDFLEVLSENHRFTRLELDPRDVRALFEPSGRVSYSAFTSGLFDLYGARKGKRLVGEKTPHYCRDIPTLSALWPAARFIHIIRDGRDVALSLMNWKGVETRTMGPYPTWRHDRVGTCAAFWDWHVRLGREDGSALGPDRYIEVRYGDLVADPEAACKRLCQFLAVPYDGSMLRFHEGRRRNKPGLSAKRAWAPVTAGLRDWRTEMPEDDVARFEAVAGDLLDELGYVRSTSRASASDAARFREAFVPPGKTFRRPRGWAVGLRAEASG
jgi:hypothetical protein